MNNLVPASPPKMDDEPGSDVKRFLATRGLLIMKEFHDINDIKCEYGVKISMSTAIISTMESSTTPSRISFGLRFEMYEEDVVRDSAFLDFDEFMEVAAALEFIGSLSAKMLTEQRDYTEVNFITKDNIKFGFYQSDGRQLAFMNLDSYGESAFLSMRTLDFVKQNIEYSKNYLISRGAKV